MQNDNGIDQAIGKITNIFVEARSVIDKEATADGKKGVKIMELCQKIGDPFGKTDAEIYHILRMYLELCPDLEIRKGRAGGIYKKVQEKTATV